MTISAVRGRSERVAELPVPVIPDGNPDVLRLRQHAERIRSSTVSPEGDHQSWARIAELHAMAYDELALAAEARAEAGRHGRHSPEWVDAIDRAHAAARRAEACHARAAAVSALDDGDPDAAARHNRAAAEAEQLASTSSIWSRASRSA
ncbi:hypothetical protein M8542_48420 [Amycolatopsis sp. OK19-0408]|uniref:Uncharacterized protein n=1 Tax=Amycolatopsis iheyensis TaxID=2945988 RepID=A0A9X2NKT0_9PSEU|nr:hypothetical protein [Amycolatopsis iheyensis]MCR6490651.1 hypothetical protein [Amycolatopsis iheyensis]